MSVLFLHDSGFPVASLEVGIILYTHFNPDTPLLPVTKKWCLCSGTVSRIIYSRLSRDGTIFHVGDILRHSII